MKLGADNPKKVIITAALTVFALVLFIYMVFSGSGLGTASAPPTANQLGITGKAAVDNRFDPSLRTDLLSASEGPIYAGVGRNIFTSDLAPPSKPPCAPLGAPSRGLRWCDKVIVLPPPMPPEIPLKFFGFASKSGEPKRVFFSQGEDVFIAQEGDIIDRRYKIVHINPASVEVKDVLGDNTQLIALRT